MSASDDLTVLELLKKTLPPPRTRAQQAAREEAATRTPEPLLETPTSTREKRRCSFDLPMDLADKFRTIAVLQRLQMRDIAQSLIAAYVHQHRALLDALQKPVALPKTPTNTTHEGAMPSALLSVTIPGSPEKLVVPIRTRPRAGERRRCSFDLPIELAENFRAIAVLHGLRMRDAAQMLITAYVEQYPMLSQA